jgi:hypothetical protein
MALRLDLLTATGHADEALGMVVPAMQRDFQRTDFARFCDAAVRAQQVVGQSEDATASIRAARRLAVADDAVIPWAARVPAPIEGGPPS